MKKYFILSVLGIMTISSVLFTTAVTAQGPDPKAPVGQAVLIASVEIENPTLVSQDSGTAELSFTLTNDMVQQTGVRYGVTLIQQKGDTQIVVDEQVYEQKLTLAENSSTPVTLTYTAPSQLTGSYDIYITSQNSSGFPFGMIKAGSIELSATTKGLSIATDSCLTHVSGAAKDSTKPLLFPSTLDGEKTLELVCTITNTSDEGVTAIPVFETKFSGAYGATSETTGGDVTPVFFAAKETKTVTIVLPKASKPQMYVVNMKLEGVGVASNTVTAHYYIPGATARILNANLNKDFYTKDEIATAAIFWGGGYSEVDATLVIKNQNGRSCAEKTTQTLSVDPVKLVSTVDMSITRDCFSPKLFVTFTEKDGAVLDSQEYGFDTTSVPKPSLPWQTAVLIVGGIVLIAAAGLYTRSRYMTHHEEENTTDTV